MILSNHAGTSDDKDYKSAKEAESKLGVHVVRHKEKVGFFFSENISCVL